MRKADADRENSVEHAVDDREMEDLAEYLNSRIPALDGQNNP